VILENGILSDYDPWYHQSKIYEELGVPMFFHGEGKWVGRIELSRFVPIFQNSNQRRVRLVA